MQQRSQDCFYSWVAGLISSSKKAQKQIKIILLDSRDVKEMFPKAASKPWLWACCAMTSSSGKRSTKSCACRGKFCQLIQWVVQGQRVSAVGVWSPIACYFRCRQKISVLPELKSPTNYSLEGWHAASYLLAECWNIWSWLQGYIRPLKRRRI